MQQGLLLAAAVGLCALPALAAKYAVHVVDPPITNHMVLPDGPLPPVCKVADRLVVRGCRGEYVPASFVVSASTPLQAVRIEVAPLSGDGGQWPQSAVDVRLVKEWYGPTPAGGRTAMPLLLVRDDNMLTIEPDPTDEDPQRMKNAAPGGLRDAAQLQPVDISDRRQFWITVHIPADAKPGVYETTVRIVPANAEASQLTLQIEVYPFDLLAPMLEYSLYYPVWLATDDSPPQFTHLSAEQMRAELKNMMAHGVSNPNIYDYPVARPDGTLDFTALDKVLDIRESIGMRPSTLYLVLHPLDFTDRELTAEERSRTHRYVPQINAWARERGYAEVFFAANDEWWGEQLSNERDSMKAVDEAGGQVFVAMTLAADVPRVSDVLHRPVLCALGQEHMEFESRDYTPEQSLRHMAEIARAHSFERMVEHKDFRRAIDALHRQGRKIYTYMNPVAGQPIPELQRRNEGLGLWRVGFDGTMTWAYAHIAGDGINQNLIFAKVLRTEDGVVDTIYWEGYRAAVDDVRYLTTLLDTLNRVRGRFPQEPLISETQAWLDSVDVANGDLDAIRHEMATRIVALLDLGYKQRTPKETLAAVNMAGIEVVELPATWRFRLDAQNVGVGEKWFAVGADDSAWDALPMTDKGWGQDLGFGWYRVQLPVTREQAAGKQYRYLHFGACDEDAWVYVNGKQVFEHSYETTGLVTSQIWIEPFVVPLHEVPLTGKDLLAVRIHNSGGMGGIWRPVRLVLSEQQLTDEQVHALILLHH